MQATLIFLYVLKDDDVNHMIHTFSPYEAVVRCAESKHCAVHKKPEIKTAHPR